MNLRSHPRRQEEFDLESEMSSEFCIHLDYCDNPNKLDCSSTREEACLKAMEYNSVQAD